MFSSRSSSVSSGSFLPQPVPNRTSSRHGCSNPVTAVIKCRRFLERIFRVDHMDFEFASWQMLYLFVSPQKVIRQSMYRKETKDQFARDDPAFLVLLGLWFIVSATLLSIVLKLPFSSFLLFISWIVLIDFIAVGIIIATVFWFIANKFMIRRASTSEDVEWGFCFDVHLNAFFPALIILHVFQLFFYSYFISQDYFLARLFGNSLWLLASCYYVYITFLGYTAVPHLKRTSWILLTIIPLSLFYLVTIISGFNICRAIMDFYHYRVY